MSRSDDLDPSDTLMVKADALIHRHRAASVDPADDLPVLQEIVGEELPELDEFVELPAIHVEEEQLPELPLEAVVVIPAAEPAPDLAAQRARQADAEAHAAQAISEMQAQAGHAIAQARAETETARQEAAAARAEALAAHAQLASIQADAQTAHAQTNEALSRAQSASMKVAERLIDLDAYMAQTLEAWISNELPQIVAAELDGMVERLRIKTLAHMRATLAPELSEKLSEILDATLGDQNTH